MNDELGYLLDALQFKDGWALGLVAWQSALRLVMVFVNSKLKEFAENALPADKPLVDSILNSRAYRLTNFIANALLSIKLPAVARKPTGNTEVFTKPPPTLLILSLAGLATLASGCSSSSFKTPGGGEYSNHSFLWRREAVEVHIGTNGEVVVKSLGSGADADALKAVASGVAEGTVQGLSKAVKP